MAAVTPITSPAAVSIGGNGHLKKNAVPLVAHSSMDAPFLNLAGWAVNGSLSASVEPLMIVMYAPGGMVRTQPKKHAVLWMEHSLMDEALLKMLVF